MDVTYQQIEEKYKSLPSDVKEVITMPIIADRLDQIGLKNGLSMSRQNELIDETGLVMLGFTHPNDFISRLVEKLEIRRDMARDIAAAVNEEVFKPIKESLQKIHGIEFVKKSLPPEKTPPTSIWEKVTKSNKSEATTVLREFQTQDLLDEKRKAIERMTEVNEKITKGDFKNPSLLETTRAEAFTLQGKINLIDGQLRGLRAVMP